MTTPAWHTPSPQSTRSLRGLRAVHPVIGSHRPRIQPVSCFLHHGDGNRSRLRLMPSRKLLLGGPAVWLALAPDAAQAAASLGVTQHQHAWHHYSDAEHALMLLAACGFFLLLGTVTGQAPLRGELRRVTDNLQDLRPPAPTFPHGPTQDSGQEPLVGGGLTHTPWSQVRRYADMTEGNEYNPEVVSARNRALAVMATCNIQLAIQESQAQVQRLVERHSHRPTQARTDGFMEEPRPVGAAETPQSRVVEQLAQHCLATRSPPGAAEHSSMADTGGAQDSAESLQIAVLEAVAEQAALEQLEVVLAVVSHSTPGSEEDSGQSVWGARRKGPGRNRDIRGGGAL